MELVEALSVLDGGREPLSDLNCILNGALAVVEDVDPGTGRDWERLLLVADGCFAEDFPSDIEGKLGGEWDRVVVGERGERKLVGLAGRRFVRGVRHKTTVRAREDTFFVGFFPFLSWVGSRWGVFLRRSG